MNSSEIEMPHWPPALWHSLEDDGLERMHTLLDALDNPHQKLPPVVHVAGTNGKGSTIAFLRAMLESAGYRVHAYTSPHIKSFRERITLAGETVSEEALHKALEICRLANEERPIRFFEGTTAAAFWLFSQHPADIVLIETGMGGTNDPTNVIEQPRLSIITPISFDHMEYLGHRLQDIAEHKAGIIKADCPVVIGFQPDEAMQVLQREAEKRDAPTLIYGTHWAVQKANDGFVYADAHGQVNLPSPGLKGPHQLLNAGAAIAAISVLEEFEVMGDHIAAGLQWVKWPGRLEPRSYDKGELWFDGGHNMAAGHMLSVVAEEEWQDELPLYVIFGTTRGKDVAAMLQPLTTQAKAIFATPVQAEPKCYTPHEIADQALDAGIEVMPIDSVAMALEEIEQHNEGQPARILVFGSLYLRLEV